jgi:hypothetical protein
MCRLENNIKIGLKHKLNNVDFIHVAQNTGHRCSFAKMEPKLGFGESRVGL